MFKIKTFKLSSDASVWRLVQVLDEESETVIVAIITYATCYSYRL
ncbi:hypothetical protein [Candidatus Atelocyanobacterium thalassae]|nr:hypothetical protein [Candidatus Atelocyanobacterium thalassa]